MPPSGFKQDAINGLLVFVQDSYEQTSKRYNNLVEQGKETEALQEAMKGLEGLAQNAYHLCATPQGIKGLADFMRYNFRDLVAEIGEGKKIEGRAMKAEIEDIGQYLATFSLHEKV